MLLFLAYASATTRVVDTSGAADRYATIASALAEAVDGDIIEVTAGTWSECVVIDTSVTIMGEGSGSTTIDAGGSCDVAVAVVADDVTITGFAIAGSRGIAAEGANFAAEDLVLDGLEGALAFSGDSLSLTDVTVSNNAAAECAGLDLAEGSTATVVRGRFEANDAGGYGGSICVGSLGSLELDGTTVTRTVGGAVDLGAGATLWAHEAVFDDNGYGIVAEDGATVSTEACSFTHNGHALSLRAGVLSDIGSRFEDNGHAIEIEGSAVLDGSEFHDGDGGGALEFEGTRLELRDATFTSNWNVAGPGGAVGVLGATDGVLVSGCTFDENDVWSYNPHDAPEGGAIAMASGALTIEDSVFRGNVAFLGGAVWHTGDDLTITGCTFEDNLGEITGGGVYVRAAEDAHVAIDLTLFEGNEAQGGVDVGAAVYATGVSSLDVSGSFFVDHAKGGALVSSDISEVSLSNLYLCGNESGTGGGALVTGADVLQITNSIFAENVAAQGGGLALSGVGDLEMAYVTMVGNEVTATGGGADFTASAGSISNSIVAFTPAGSGVYAEDAASGDGVSVGFSLWHDNSPTDAGGAFAFSSTADGNQQADPGLTDFTADGNCWNDAFGLSAASAARDAGDGVDRDGTPADLGATGGPGSDWEDLDGDGFFSAFDCDDTDPAVGAVTEEIPYDGLDQDCDGADLDDADQDGFSASEVGGPDCDDADADIHPGAIDPPGDGIDQDCGGAPDTASDDSDSGNSWG